MFSTPSITLLRLESCLKHRLLQSDKPKSIYYSSLPLTTATTGSTQPTRYPVSNSLTVMKISNPQFLIISAQSFGEESQQTVAHRKIARSHAARASHARVRRLRTLQYQARTRSVKSSVPARDEHQYSQTHQKFPVISLLSASRQDPFTCFATPLKPIEEMLFDHCASSQPVLTEFIHPTSSKGDIEMKPH